MANMKRTEQVSVAQLIEELKRFEKDYPDVNVTCCIPDGTICYAVSIDQDGDGQVCIGFEEEEEDSGCLEVEMLIADLEMYDGSAIVRMEACGLSMLSPYSATVVSSSMMKMRNVFAVTG